MELSRICGDGILESSNSTRFHPPPVSEFLLGGIDNSPSKNFEEIEIPLSIDNSSKKRRNWGEGNGTIHWRTITRGGKDYPQAYYHWQEKGSFNARTRSPIRYGHINASNMLIKKSAFSFSNFDNFKIISLLNWHFNH